MTTPKSTEPTTAGAADVTKAFKLSIVIDNQDEYACPDAPFTLNVYRAEDGSDQKHLSVTPDQEECIIGSDIPTMLRELADLWEAYPVDFGYAVETEENQTPLPTEDTAGSGLTNG